MTPRHALKKVQAAAETLEVSLRQRAVEEKARTEALGGGDADEVPAWRMLESGADDCTEIQGLLLTIRAYLDSAALRGWPESDC